MQTGTARGMMTLEQSLAELVLRGVIDQEVALARSSRPDQLLGLIERNSLDPEQEQQIAAASGLRVAGG
jgi:Tfp pilus assembly ATPase PilU